MIFPKVKYKNLGRISYQEAWDYQTRIHKDVVKKKLANRHLETKEEIIHFLLFCEHNPVYTLGKSGSIDHLLLAKEDLLKSKIEFFQTNRGGDITYHGPGQITGYPIFDLDGFFTDVHKYVRYLEEVVILTLSEYGVKGDRIKEHTGVWILSKKKSVPHRKICAIGVHLSRWVTMHGFAFNVNTNLNHFSNIIPCGIVDRNKTVTSLSQELGKKISLEEVKEKLKVNFASLFQFRYINE